MRQKGFIPIPLFVIVSILIVGTAGGFLYINNLNNQTNKTGQSGPSSNLITPSPTGLATQPTSTYKPTNTPSKTATKSSPTPTKKVTTSTPVSLPKITCTINTSAISGWSPVWVRFDYTSSDQGRVVAQEWDFIGDGAWRSEGKSTDWTYRDVKSYEAKLRLKLSDGSYSETCSKTITVNSPSVNCNINASVTSGSAPLAVNFTYGADFHGTNDYVTDVQWDFNGDGNWDTPYDYSSQNPPSYTFLSRGNYTAKMHLKTHNGVETSICTKDITVN